MNRAAGSPHQHQHPATASTQRRVVGGSMRFRDRDIVSMSEEEVRGVFEVPRSR